MPSQKHLVLDDDVHESLSRKKTLSGLPLKQIGNSLLRASQASEMLTSVVGKLLAEQGRVSTDEFQHMLDNAAKEIRETQLQSAALVTATPRGTFVSGSWEMSTVVTANDDNYQLLECWARDDNRLPMAEHHHDVDEFFVVLAGRLLMTLGGTPHVLGQMGMLQVPAGCIHTATPLNESTHMLVLLTPALPEYRTDRE